jgi:hypothetical protein
MKANWVKVAVAIFVLLTSLSAVAAEGTGKVTLLSPVQLNGKKIVAGDYTISWTGKDNDVQVTFKAGKNVVMTAPAKLIEDTSASAYTSLGYDKDGSLNQIRFRGKKTFLVFLR